MKKAIVVAHPDDEIIFFSSVVERADLIIVCFGPSESSYVTDGREVIQRNYPLQNVEWMNLQESKVYLSANWNTPTLTEFGMRVTRDKDSYEKNFLKISAFLKTKLTKFDVIYTHNPWGEYGHEEHVSVFRAVCSAVKSTNKTIYVSGYLSDRSRKLFDTQKALLSSNVTVKNIPKTLCASIKSLYMANNCWTWDKDFIWPDTELFIKIDDYSFLRKSKGHPPSASPPVVLLSASFKISLAGVFIRRLLPGSLKKFLKIVFKRS